MEGWPSCTPLQGSGQRLVTQGPGPEPLCNLQSAGERLMQGPCSQARASGQHGGPTPSVISGALRGQTRMLCGSGLSGAPAPKPQ